MMHPKEKITVIDDYFPSWMVEHISRDLEMMPVRYNNSPYADYTKARFFGSQIVLNDQFIDIPPWWWIEYFNHCMYHDVCKEWTVGHCHRVLLNAQLPSQSGLNHTDADSDHYLSVIYMGHGTSGDTVFMSSDNTTEYESDRIEWKLGRLIIFNSALVHRGEAPSDGYRVSLGAVYPSVPITQLPNIG